MPSIYRLDVALNSPEETRSVLGDVEGQLAKIVIDLTRGNVAKAARMLGVNRRSMYRILDRHDLRQMTENGESRPKAALEDVGPKSP